MKHQVYLGITIRIFILFTIAMLATFLPEQLRCFFGDTPITETCHDYHVESWTDDDWHWGVRHYWYYWMMVLLFITTLVSAVSGIVKSVNKHYPDF